MFHRKHHRHRKYDRMYTVARPGAMIVLCRPIAVDRRRLEDERPRPPIRSVRTADRLAGGLRSALVSDRWANEKM